ncbi:hypothetical protein KP509_29G080700 [Ceratopteris richardii]|uniref:HIG1 domain-containing protein n=1 Tax=Ceratopteris richardii TaxID=49495 RepID=A0A8T2R8E4_CERRI|nr:hypothetical protein KP509_29G080700 [Ceratopteris richardii]
MTAPDLGTEELFGKKKYERNPLVPLGAFATLGVLVFGLVSFRQGNHKRSQLLMRARVGVQAATVALMVGTVYFGTKRDEESGKQN